MRENPLYLQILIMAHCVGHSDFFKNNRTFRNTNPSNIVSKMRNAKRRIFEYSENPMIGQKKVEDFLDSLHAIRFQTERYELPRETPEKKQRDFIDRINNSKLFANANEEKKRKYEDMIKRKGLIGNDYDLLGFFLDYGDFENWQLDLINIVRDESHYFIPQIIA
jgi:stage V sporulation protein R